MISGNIIDMRKVVSNKRRLRNKLSVINDMSLKWNHEACYYGCNFLNCLILLIHTKVLA